MRVGIATVHTPGIHGGAEFLVDGLVEAVRAAGHSVHKISMPFYFEPMDAAAKTMDHCLSANFLPYGGGQIDRMICLKFPAYMIRHPDKRVWLLHQHRSAYGCVARRKRMRFASASSRATLKAWADRRRAAPGPSIPSPNESVPGCASITVSSRRHSIIRRPMPKNSGLSRPCPTSSFRAVSRD